MRTAKLTRKSTGDQGTVGELVLDNGWRCVTLERPWRNNAHGISCILPGVFLCELAPSPKFGTCYHVRNTPGRDLILIHPANLAGDTDKGFVAQVEGCIALGADVAKFSAGTPPAGAKDQIGVSVSKLTVSWFEEQLNAEDLELTVVWAPGIGPA